MYPLDSLNDLMISASSPNLILCTGYTSYIPSLHLVGCPSNAFKILYYIIDIT